MIVIGSAIALLSVCGMPAAMASDEAANLESESLQLLARGNRITATVVMEKGFASARRLYPEGDPRIDEIEFQLARMHDLYGLRDRALVLYQDLVDRYEDRDENDPKLADLHYGIASVLQNLDAEKAIKEYEKALHVMRKNGMDQKNTASELYIRAEYHLAYVYLRDHDRARAVRAYKKALDDSIELFGEDAAVTAEATFAEGQYFTAIRAFSKAEDSFLAALKVFRMHYKEEDPNILGVHAALVSLYEAMNESEKATDHLMVLAELSPDEDGKAQPIYRLEPQYPMTALMNDSTGGATLSFKITTDGHVSDIKVVDSQGMKTFTKAAVEAVSKWRYKPKIVDGKPVTSEASYTFDFGIKKRVETGSHILK